jgi:hypothetical protein
VVVVLWACNLILYLNLVTDSFDLKGQSMYGMNWRGNRGVSCDTISSIKVTF